MPSNSSDITWTEKTALIIGRAYPEPSRRHIETVCTGAITEDGELLRLYPIPLPLRYLQDSQRYKLWTWARFEIQKSQNDKRKESFRVREDSIKIISQVESKGEQFALLQKAIVKDRETLDKNYRNDWTSLGIIPIEFIDLEPRLPRTSWKLDKSYIDQANLFVEKKPLEQPPIELRLTFRCKNNPTCRHHGSRLIAWEYMEAFRKFRQRYGSSLAAFGRIKDALFKQSSSPRVSTYALMGTHSRYPIWMVGQLYFIENTAVESPMLF